MRSVWAAKKCLLPLPKPNESWDTKLFQWMTHCVVRLSGSRDTVMSGRNNTEFSHPRLAIIAALQREIAPIIHGWKHRDVEHGGKTLRFYESEKQVLVCGGIRASAAHLVPEAAVNTYHPEPLVAPGLAGSLTRGANAGEAFLPAVALDHTHCKRISPR